MSVKMSTVNEQEVGRVPTSLAKKTLQAVSADFPAWEKGYLQVYTGNGKGKTTAALGLTLRAVGNGARVFIAQFMKNGAYGEIKALQNFNPRVRVQQFGTGKFLQNEIDLEDYQSCRQGILTIKKIWLSGNYNLVILDEINVALFYGLLSLKELMDIVKLKPNSMELVFTGRYAPPELLEVADLVTEMREIKHYYHIGLAARLAIEK